MASISGLSSGLDTATIINQLMQLEAAPQTRLKTRVTSEQSTISTLRTLNTKAALLASKADALAAPAAWDVVRTSSSNSAVSVSATAAAGKINLTATVTGVAVAHQLGFAQVAALTDQVTGAGTMVRIDRFDGSPVEIDSGDGTLAGLVAAINDTAAETGLRASTVKVSEGSYRLIVESATTGAESDFDLTAQDGSPLLGGTTVRAGTDASIDFGVGVTATSASNTFTDVLPGVTITLGAAATVGSVSTLTVERDTASISASIKGLVDSVNALLTDIDSQSTYSSSTNTAGALTGNSTVRSLRNALLEAVYPADGSSMAGLGIQVTRAGKLEFDPTAFAQAYAADPVGVAEQFTTTGAGFAARVQTVAGGASDSVDGTLSTAISGRENGVKRMETSIEEWDRRLELRRITLERTFTSLETALNQMTSQSSWLSGQLSSLSGTTA
ncbi:flagellar filament capping protein FliD [Nocardioides sp.]|uniref:flagellar filament capping protein FliD n=1 Tax=Nocardioides sp. TaxID=35761 RepID=UPI002B275AED|nr:flagellar filament capping protein FliD [Nocardioides sp.]